MEEGRLKTYSPLALAFIGDAVYSLYMRDYVVNQANAPASRLHKMASNLVSAGAQAAAADALTGSGILEEEELAVYRRGKNAHTVNSAKNASRLEYHKATGLEALVGWLYLKGDRERLSFIMRKAVEIQEGQTG